jgi:hypothetical protein
MRRCRIASLFLILLAVGVLWPAVAGAVVPRGGGGCCKERPGACGIPTTGFSLCCFHSFSTLPELQPPAFVPAVTYHLAAADESGAPPPDPSGILHVPRAFLV